MIDILTSLSYQQENVLALITLVAGSLSGVGCLFIFFSYLLFQEFRLFHLRLILYLCVSDLGGALVSAIGSQIRKQEIGSLFCKTNGAAIQFFYLSSLLWTSCIAHTLDQVIRKLNGSVEKYEKYYHLICWGLPAASVVYLWLTDRFGDAGLWCWISHEEQTYRFLLFYAPLGIVLLYNCITYFTVSHKINSEREKTRTEIEENHPNTIQATFRWFLLAFIACWVFGIANRIQNYLQPDKPLFWLYVLHGLLSPLQGFFNSIIYGFNDELREKYRQFFSRYYSCCAPGYVNVSVQDDDEEQHFGHVHTHYDSND